MKRILLTILFTYCSLSMFAQVVYVDSSATGTNDGSSWLNAYVDLKNAISSTASGQIWVAQGTYFPTTGTDENQSFSMKNNLAIYGGFVGTETMLNQRDWENNKTILSGDIGVKGDTTDNTNRVVRNSTGTLDSTAILDGVIIQDGNGTSGVGIYCAFSAPSFYNCIVQNNVGISNLSNGVIMEIRNASAYFNNCTFRNNYTPAVGGCHLRESSTRFDSCKFENNIAKLGGAVYGTRLNTNPVFTGCEFTNNQALESHGGAMYIEYFANATINHCTFTNNKTMLLGRSGGAIFGVGGDTEIKVSNSTFVGNEASNGGAVFQQCKYMRFENCLFYGNKALQNNGGGLYVSTRPTDIHNCTFVNNTAVVSGGGFYVQKNDTLSMTNTIIRYNEPYQITNTSGNWGPVSIFSHNNYEDSIPGLNNTVVIPSFIDTAANDYSLNPCSDLVDAGLNDSITSSIDANGNNRIENGTVDIGALEFNGEFPSGFANAGLYEAVCVGTDVTLTASGGEVYIWNGTDTATSITKRLNTTTTFTVDVTDSSGCMESDTVVITVNPIPAIEIIENGTELTASNTEGELQWYIDGQLIEGEEDTTFQVLENGEYTVQITDLNGCQRISEEVEVSVLSIDENSINSFRIHPNPSKGAIYVASELEIAQLNKIVLFDLRGSIIQEIEVTSNRIELDAKDGIYLLELLFLNGVTSTQRIIIQH